MAKTSASAVLVVLVVVLFLDGYNAAESLETGYQPPPGKADPPPPGYQPPPGKADPPPPGYQPPPGKADPPPPGYQPPPGKADPPPPGHLPPPAPPVAPAPPAARKPCFFGICPIFNCATFCFGIGYSDGQCSLIIRCCCS
ncbi:unnamed protein product [Vicia faba]|uniref:Uncharacterized protein n=1 Tax=Vicia faba TaxID=3906 RepID=A0AAV0YG80_VICFA|nr:unnamed protein product [Vicia faba]